MIEKKAKKNYKKCEDNSVKDKESFVRNKRNRKIFMSQEGANSFMLNQNNLISMINERTKNRKTYVNKRYDQNLSISVKIQAAKPLDGS